MIEEDSDEEQVDDCLNFLENIEKALEDEPLSNSAQKRSNKIALRHRLRTFKKTDNKKSLNIKKLSQHTKRNNNKFKNQIQQRAAQNSQ